MRKNVAVILAGGSGTRAGYEKPKQFMKIAGKLVIEHTIERFQKHPLIDEIAIVSHADFLTLIEEIVNHNSYDKVKKILQGGKERYESSLTAIEAYDEDLHLIFHDAVRPLVSDRIIKDVVEALNRYNAVDVAIPAADTIIEVENDRIVNIPDRSRLYRGQTPQGFRRETIKKAYDFALQDSAFKVTDDCGVVKRYLPEEKIYVVAGEEANMKLTYKEDFYLLDKLFQLKSIQNLDNDPSLLKRLEGKSIVVFGASYGIGQSIVELAEANGAHVHGFSRQKGKVDVSDPKSVAEALRSVYEKKGAIDYVINTAGLLHKEPLNHMDYSRIEEEIRVNYLGSVNVAKESFRYLKETKGALLLFTSSSYTRGRAMYSIYSSTKAAIVNFVQAIASEWEPFGVTVNCINPERTATPMRRRTFGKEDEKTLLQPTDVARVSLQSLLLDATGQVIDVRLANLENG
ncbi:2-C-methyl-D-erythritol 4-phosphate cytidylyltransferase [Hydrogenimonas urashimensis]|uniref:2-C-methyl-D-erythritol 4-phosphate cytidylyltransferase n=1 Tax=Hydrogenimonas urashimensis TaxID=2740515 RepID=UPI001915F208|nr:2-C-methyl-D-erythritol 4-phosphate cytidylyltransferase [Hydrogenimonas urashimensis]